MKQNKQQTAVQDLIQELKQFKKFPMVDQPTIEAAIEFAELRLEKEKEQIIKAYQQATTDEYGDSLDFSNDTQAEDYYNEAYGGSR